MKIRGEVFGCLLVMAAVQTAWSDAGDDHTDQPENICLRPGHDEFANAMKIGNACVETGGALFGLAMYQSNQTIADFREFFEGFCRSHQGIRRCLLEKTVELESCDLEEQVKVFRVYRGILERLLNVECVEGNGERFAIVYHGLVGLSKVSSFAELDLCISKASAVVKSALRTGNDAPSKLYTVYKQMSTFKRCLHGTEMGAELREALVFLLNEMITAMECIHPQDKTLVLCSSIDAGLIDACVVRRKGNVIPPYDDLENQEALCYDFLVTRDRWVGDGSVTLDNDALLKDTKTLCRVVNTSIDCIGQTSDFNDLCLDDVQRRELALLVEFSKDAFRYACFGDVESVVDVMFKVYRLQRTGHGHAVWDCIALAKAARSVTDYSSRNMRFYREMVATRTCLVDKLKGEAMVIDHIAAAFVDKLLKMVKCVQPEDGTTVLCETLLDQA